MPVTDSLPIAIQAHGLRKSFGVKDQAVETVSELELTVAARQIFGFLGPNGAGKTTTLRILTTLLPADAGEAYVAGADVMRNPRQVRRRIGYVGQLGGADGSATGLENLLLQARLYGMTAPAAASRAEELVELFDLGAFAGRIVRSYSGGQRRRLEVAPDWLRVLGHLNPMYYTVQAARDLAAGTITTSAVGTGFLVTGAAAALAMWWGTRSYQRAMA